MAQIRPKFKKNSVHQIANDKKIVLSTKNVQKVHSMPKLLGFEKKCGKFGQSPLTGTLFKQLPWAQIGLKFKYFCAHKIANNQTIILNTEKV